MSNQHAHGSNPISLFSFYLKKKSWWREVRNGPSIILKKNNPFIFNPFLKLKEQNSSLGNIIEQLKRHHQENQILTSLLWSVSHYFQQPNSSNTSHCGIIKAKQVKTIHTHYFFPLIKKIPEKEKKKKIRKALPLAQRFAIATFGSWEARFFLSRNAWAKFLAIVRRSRNQKTLQNNE